MLFFCSTKPVYEWVRAKIWNQKSLLALCLLSFLLVSAPPIATADIFEWEWVNPGDHSQGKQPSTTLVPDGPGFRAILRNLPQAYLRDTNLTNADFLASTLTSADLSGANLTAAVFRYAKLTNADLSGANLTDADFFKTILTNAKLNNANLTDADFYKATLTGTDYTNAKIRGARLGYTTGFTAAQLYSTSSYQAGDLTGVGLRSFDLTGWNFGVRTVIPTCPTR